jgi:DNA-3-methyladenine glycosylase
MFAEGGIAYVYLCYGIHHLFNIVTHSEGVPHAVLIRALEPVEGIPTMCQRRKLSNLHPRLTNGPGSLSAALGIHTGLSGTPLKKGLVWLEDHGTRIRADQVVCSPRVGVGYAGDHAHRPWRFRIKGSPWTSPAK